MTEFDLFETGGPNCHGCGSLNPSHEYEGEHWCDGCLNQKLARDF